MKSERGITLITLVITIILLILVASISISSGVVTIKNAKFNKAKNEMELLQANVGQWNKEYYSKKTDQEKAEYLEAIGVDTSNEEICNPTVLQKTVEDVKIDPNDYRFLTSTYLKEKLGLEDSYEFLVDIIDKKVVLFNGIEYEGTTYYTPEDFDINVVVEDYPSDISFNLTQGEDAEFIISDIKIKDSNGKDTEIKNFKVKYKLTSDTDWKDITTDLERFKDADDGNKIKYMFNNKEYGTFSVIIYTVDNIISSTKSIDIPEPNAIFKTGREVNIKMKQLSGDVNPTASSNNTEITAVKRANTIANQYKTNDYIVSTPESNTPIYMWFENGTIYYYTKDKRPSSNTNSSSFFSGLTNAETIEIEDMDTSQVTNMAYMFTGCNNVQILDVCKFNTSQVTSMYAMFNNCQNMQTLDVSEFDTSKVTDMGNMFSECRNVQIFDVSKFDTSKVTNMRLMFYNCKKVQTLDVSNFDTSSVTNMESMFNCCNAKTLDVSNFDTNRVINMGYMFYNSNVQILNLSNFDVSNVTNVTNMLNVGNSLTSLTTPKVYPSNTSLEIVLPKTLYDSSNNTYTKLTSTSPTQTLLTAH